MTAISITAANVLKGEGARQAKGIAGGSLTAGLAVYVDGSDGDKIKAASNAAAGTATVAGIALHAATAGQPVAYQTEGEIDIGGTVAVGMMYALGTAGGIIPVADLANPVKVSYLGYGVDANTLALRIVNTGLTWPA